ncbi:hypothetical protein SpCBS45565_g01146 [Spizellomyces sp. 'palustris']|nr:hypothetical protein SpCBS45565_g01146 [Spizellomyces sp. 'palustris']
MAVPSVMHTQACHSSGYCVPQCKVSHSANTALSLASAPPPVNGVVTFTANDHYTMPPAVSSTRPRSHIPIPVNSSIPRSSDIPASSSTLGPFVPISANNPFEFSAMLIPREQCQQSPSPPATSTRSERWLLSSNRDLARLAVLIVTLLCEPEGIPCTVPHNVSGHDTSDPKLVSFTEQILRATNLYVSSVYVALWYMWQLRCLRCNGNADFSARWAAHTLLGKIKEREDGALTLITLALMLANKIQDDHTYTNRTWNQLTKIPLEELNSLERGYLRALGYRLQLSDVDFSMWRAKVDAFWVRRAGGVPRLFSNSAPKPRKSQSLSHAQTYAPATTKRNVPLQANDHFIYHQQQHLIPTSFQNQQHTLHQATIIPTHTSIPLLPPGFDHPFPARAFLPVSFAIPPAVTATTPSYTFGPPPGLKERRTGRPSSISTLPKGCVCGMQHGSPLSSYGCNLAISQSGVPLPSQIDYQGAPAAEVGMLFPYETAYATNRMFGHDTVETCM